MIPVNRRQFVQGAGVAGLGLLAGCGVLPGQVQAPAKVSHIGVLTLVTADPSDVDNAAFRQGLRDLGYSEGQNITLEWRTSSSGVNQYPELAADLVGLPVDLIVAQGLTATRAAKQASVTTPVVMAYSPDPVRNGFVASLARPGGNVTGLASLSGQLGAKHLELLRDTVHGLARVAILWSPGTVERADEVAETAAAAQALGLGLQSVEQSLGGDLEAAFERILQGRAEALFVQGNLVTNRYRAEIGEFATAHRLPTIASSRRNAEAGMLMSYGPDIAALNRRAAYYVDRILKGAKPADLPIEQPMTFEFVVNLKTAQVLGLTIPQHILLQATEIIQ
jgi:putative tryptophan/tyrosine transport system substrate-binding protein